LSGKYPADSETSELRTLIEQFSEDWALHKRYFDIPLSEEDIAAKGTFLERSRAVLDSLPFESLSLDGQIDYLLLRNLLAYEQEKLSWQAERERELLRFLPFAKTIVELEQGRRCGKPLDAQRAGSALSAAAQEVERAGPLVRRSLAALARALRDNELQTLAGRLVRAVERLREIVQRWHKFYRGYDPAHTWWASAPYTQLDSALEKLAIDLRRQYLDESDEASDTAVVGDPVGRRALVNELRFSMVAYSPEELLGIAQRELSWCEERMVAASKEMGCGADWKKALERVKEDHVPPGEQPTLVRELAREAIEFVAGKQLVTVPTLARELWRVDMLPPEKQRVNPFFTGGEVISVAYPTDEMPHEEKLMRLRGNNRHFARATVHHELIPGHFLQGYMAARHRKYRAIFRTPFYVEGWCLHWEMLLWDLGFAKTPENRVGMLFWRMHRCARVLFSINFHLGQMTAEQCVALLVERVGMEQKNAEAEVRRSLAGDFPPLYQCAYLIGGLQLRALHRELVGSGKMTNREFHDAVLQENAIPVELIRAKLTGQRLAREFRPAWRFAQLAEE